MWRVARTGRYLWPAVALACVLAAPALAQTRTAVYEDQAQIFKSFPSLAQPTDRGVRVRLRTGLWSEIIDNPFASGVKPVPYWYAPKLQVLGICQNSPTLTITLLRVTPRDVFEEGDVSFDDDVSPAGWAGLGCFRLKTKAGGAWLEKGVSGWTQRTPAQSAICQKRHGG